MGLLRDNGVAFLVLKAPARVASLLRSRAYTWMLSRIFDVSGEGVSISYRCAFQRPRDISISAGVKIAGSVIFVSEFSGAVAKVCEGVQICDGVHIDHSGGLTIGPNSLISEGVRIYTHSHGHDPRSSPVPLEKKIGGNVWIGVGALVLEGCRVIVDDVVIAAGSVVTKDIQEKGVYGGVPAKHIAFL